MEIGRSVSVGLDVYVKFIVYFIEVENIELNISVYINFNNDIYISKKKEKVFYCFKNYYCKWTNLLFIVNISF